MENIAEFTPIQKNIKQDILNYYNENDLSLPENPIIQEYFLGSSKGSNLLDATFYAGKAGGKSKKKVAKKPTQKQNPPRFNTAKPYGQELSSSLNWPQKDSTISTLINESKDFGKNKDQFLKEIKQLKMSNADQEYVTKLAEHESTFRPNITNQLGYFGYYQFGRTAMKDVGFTKEDMKNPINQHIAAIKYKQKNLKPFINFVNKKVNGIQLNENNLAAAAHLAGASGLRDWLNGTKTTDFAKRGFVDANGTHITKYLKDFL